MTEGPAAIHKGLHADWISECVQRGAYILDYHNNFISAAHTDEDAQRTWDIAEDAFRDPEILRLSRATTMVEDEQANAEFPDRRLGRVTLTLRDGQLVSSELMTPRWDADAPPSETELRSKFHDLADPILGPARASENESALHDLKKRGLSPLFGLIVRPINRDTTAARSS